MECANWGTVQPLELSLPSIPKQGLDLWWKSQWSYHMDENGPMTCSITIAAIMEIEYDFQAR